MAGRLKNARLFRVIDRFEGRTIIGAGAVAYFYKYQHVIIFHYYIDFTGQAAIIPCEQSQPARTQIAESDAFGPCPALASFHAAALIRAATQARRSGIEPTLAADECVGVHPYAGYR